MTDNNKKSPKNTDWDDAKAENLKRKKKQRRELKQTEDETYLDELIEDVNDENLYHLMKKIK